MRRIFVVEDDKFITAIFTMFLRDLGHELVGGTSSGNEAVKMCKELKPDVVLMDIHLDGELDGIQTAELLKREVNIPVIYVSSDTSSQVIERAIVTNSYGFLVKPINKKELGISIDLAYYKHKVDVEQNEREKGYREFISASPFPIVVVTNGKIMYLNCLGLDVFKTHYIEDVIGLPINNFIQEDYLEEFTEKVNASIKDDSKIEPFFAQLKTVHGDTYRAEITGSKVRFNNKVSVQVIIKDASITDACERRKQLYEKVLLGKNKIVFVLDNEGKVLKTNAFTQDELGVKDIEGKKIYTLFDDDCKWIRVFKETITPDVLEEEMELQFNNGKTYILNCNTLTSPKGEVLEWMITEN
ncbi:response regulator [Plebeiibacterium sediminum]|uniref:Response regulator n=1 Tax=Plebeiibacterium sediminum TaxID=2992112 RepID=A0AAE3SGI9_9BACT|nr:response regulator [Plebeiobacterium sediminum]MCW3788386.1 response regulator [Plebeiobacterium sediminum]